MTSTVVQHSVEVVGTSVAFVDVDHAAGLDAAGRETEDVGLVCAVPVADAVVCCNDVCDGIVPG